jgi:hypothetical protein
VGTNCIITNGEQNDQLFGFDAVGRFMNRFGAPSIHEPFDRARFLTFFNDFGGEPALSELYLGLFERIHDAAPMELRSNLEFLWWMNFTLKWQNAYMRSLAGTPARNVAKVTREYIDTHYASFYGTDEFQLWSMNNLDKRIKDEWRTYKWPCKDIIYAFDGDKEYRDNKTKRGSLRHVIVQQHMFFFIDEDFRFFNEFDTEKYYVPKNDLVRR